MSELTPKGIEKAMSGLMPNTIARKILKVSQLVGHIDKNGENKHFKFKYQAWDDVLPAVRDACVQVGLAIIPSFRIIDAPQNRVYVQGSFTLYDADDPSASQYLFEWPGESLNQDDKGVQKAITSATKYALLKLFMIPCADTVDPDDEAPQKAKQTAKAAPTDIIKECGDWWKANGGTSDTWKQCKRGDSKPHELINEARVAGCASAAEVLAYINDGELPGTSQA